VSEPRARAPLARRIAPYTMHWSVSDDRIGGARSDSYALRTRAGVFFFDPLPLTYGGADDFPSVTAAMLTAGCHQRASWRYRFEHGARVWAPRGSYGLMGDPDMYFTEETSFPADIEAIYTPGPQRSLYSFYRPGELSVVFVGDLIRRPGGEGPLKLARPDPRLDPDVCRQSVKRLLTLEIDLLCLSHGGWIDDRPKDALRELLERDE
jgi:glyoxylase-like metal-dependent hydrolase (beta-lactamase superfamily II)